MMDLGIGYILVRLISFHCLGGAAVRRQTHDRKVTGLTPGWALSSQLGQLSLG